MSGPSVVSWGVLDTQASVSLDLRNKAISIDVPHALDPDDAEELIYTIKDALRFLAAHKEE